MNRPLRMLLSAALLAIATVATYAPVLSAGFVDIDDADFVTENAHVRAGLSAEGALWALREAHASNWIPLTWLSHMLDVELFGLDARGHHAVNLGLHVANALALFAVLASLTRAAAPSFAVAALFALHPANVESVAWISQRKTLLSTFFGLLAIAAWARHARSGSRRAYAASCVAFACSLLAKPTLVTLPFGLLLLDAWPLRRTALGWRRLAAEKAPLFALSAAASAATLLAQQAAIATGETFPLAVRLGNAVLSYVRYLETWAWPTRLAVYYPLYEDDVTAANVGAAAALLLAITALVLGPLRERRHLAVGWLWFVGTLVPVIGVVQVGAQAMADRYVYAPFWGLSIALAWSVWEALPPRPALRAAAGGALLAASVALGALAHGQAEKWQDTIALLEDAVADTERNYVAERGLAAQYFERREWQRAREHAERGARHPRALADVLPVWGMALYQEGRRAEAVAKLEEASRVAPDDARAYANLGWIHLNEGDAERANDVLARAVALDPSHAQTQHMRGLALVALDRLDEAAEAFAAVVSVNPQHFDAWIERARALAKRGRFAEAARALDGALVAAAGFDPERRALLISTLQQYRGDALQALGDARAAASAYEAAIASSGGSYAPHASLALLLATSEDAELRDATRAVALAERACALSERRRPDALSTLALVYGAAGRSADAARTAQEALARARESGDAAAIAALEARLAPYLSPR